MMYPHKLSRVSFAQFMISDVGIGLLVHFQVRDTLVVLDVAGNEGKVMLDGRRCNENIKITNNLACPPQFSSNASKVLHDWLCRRKNND